MNKTVNAPVNGAVRAETPDSQVLENAWRRVGESNPRTRICNPLRNHSANSPTWCTSLDFANSDCKELSARLSGFGFTVPEARF